MNLLAIGHEDRSSTGIPDLELGLSRPTV